MAFVTFKGTDEGPVVGVYETGAEATTAASSLDGVVAASASVSDQVDIGWYYKSNAVTDSLVGDAVVNARRETLKVLLRKLEAVGGLAVWAAEGDTNTAERVKSYRRWVEMMVRASSVDSNLSSDSRYNRILTEAQIDGRTWYWLHNPVSWKSYIGDDRSGWAFFNTVGTSTTPGSRGGIERSAVGVSVASGFNWVAYLGS